MLWRWESGRQGGGYDKLLLARSKLLKFDLYVLRFPEGSKVPMHRDPVPVGFKHHRINWTLRFAERGGHTLIEKLLDTIVPTTGVPMRLQEARVYRFRPDVQRHMMSTVNKGSLLMVSLGWLSRGSI